MAQEKRTFTGGMDFDTEARYVQKGDYRAAINLRPGGEGDGAGALENIIGSKYVNDTTSFQVTAGGGTVNFTNITSIFAGLEPNAKVVGKYRDETLDRIIYFVHGPVTGYGFIIEYNQKREDLSLIATSPLFNFDEDFLITGVNIVGQGEDYAPEGLLYWTDGKNPPRKINIAKAKILSSSADIDDGAGGDDKYYSSVYEEGFETTLTDGYSSLTEQNISAIKYPATKSPNVIFGTDSSVSTNNMINNQWQFKYRYIYDDKERSAWSPISEIKNSGTGTPLGSSVFNTNNYIELSFNSGTSEVAMIEFASRKANLKTDFFLIDSVDTSFSSTPSGLNQKIHSASSSTGVDSVSAILSEDTTYYYRFYNNGVYSNIDLKDSVKPFDNIPMTAKSQDVIDGNRIVYGDVVDGKDGRNVNGSTSTYYRPYTVSSNATLLSYSSVISSDTGTNGWNTSQRRSMNCTLKIDLSNAITGGNLPSGSNIVLNVNRMGVYYGFFAGQEDYMWGATVDFNFQLLNLPAMNATNFYQMVKDEIEMMYPSASSVLNNVHTWTDTAGDDPPFHGPGHADPEIFAPGEGGVSASFDGNIWSLSGSVLELRFSVVNGEPYSTVEQQNFNFILGHDWSDILTDYPEGATSYAPSPTPAYAINSPNGIRNVEEPIGAIFGAQVEAGGFNSPSASASASGVPMIALEHSSLPTDVPHEDMGFKSGAYHNLGVVYYDSANRSSSVQSINSDVYIPSFLERPNGVDFNPASIKVEIMNKPPSWATSWQLVYSGNRNIERFWQFRVDSFEIISGKVIMNMSPLFDLISTSNAEALYYDFVDGDRVSLTEDISGASFDTDSDYKIIGQSDDISSATLQVVVDTQAGSANTSSSSFFQAGALVQVYRPKKEVSEEDTFYYEISQEHPIVGGNHHVDDNTVSLGSLIDSSGTTEQTVENQHQTAVDTPGSGAIVLLNRGDVYHRARLTPGYSSIDFVEDFNGSDYFKSDNWDAGRPNIINKDLRESRRPATVFYSDPFIPNTNINGLSSIFPDDYYEEFDKTYGSIQKLHSRENQLIIFQEDKVSRAQVNRNIITTGSGDQILTAQGAIISQSIPYAGEYGISNQPESFAEYAEVLYFTDVKRGAVLRLSGNGITPISAYRMNNWFTDVFGLLSLGKPTTLRPSWTPRVYGGFNPKDKEYMVNIDSGDNSFLAGSTFYSLTSSEDYGIGQTSYDGGSTTHRRGESIRAFNNSKLIDKTIVFSERNNRWTYFQTANGMMEYINNDTVNFSSPSWTQLGGTTEGGRLYINRRPVYDAVTKSVDNYGLFYDGINGSTPEQSQLLLVSNIEPSSNKVYDSIGLEATSLPSNFEIQNSRQQYSLLKEAHFDTREGMHYSNIYGDINSFKAYDATNILAGMINGERLRDTYASIRIAGSYPTVYRLFAVNIGVTPSSKSGVV